MIKVKDYKKWERIENCSLLNMIAVGYDPVMKKYFINKNGFDENCKIANSNKFVDILCQVILLFVGDRFRVSLKNKKFSWLPNWIKNKKLDLLNISSYLDKITWKKDKYFGSFKIDDIKTFLSIFIEYPFKYQYQDIELFSLNSDFVMVISYHANFWFIAREKDILKKIAMFLENNGATVFPVEYLE